MMDLNYTRDTTSGQEGLEVIPRIQALDDTLPIVVMTAWATVDLAVEAMKLGARDFVTKPWDNDAFSRLSAPRLRSPVRSGKASSSRRRTNCSEARCQTLFPSHRECVPCIELISLASRLPMPMF